MDCFCFSLEASLFLFLFQHGLFLHFSHNLVITQSLWKLGCFVFQSCVVSPLLFPLYCFFFSLKAGLVLLLSQSLVVSPFSKLEMVSFSPKSSVVTPLNTGLFLLNSKLWVVYHFLSKLCVYIFPSSLLALPINHLRYHHSVRSFNDPFCNYNRWGNREGLLLDCNVRAL